MDARVRTIAFAYLFAVYAYIQPVGFRNAYPTLSDRLGFARSFGASKGIRLLYGQPHDIATVAGYTAWRVGGVLAIAAALFGLLAAVRGLRTEEDAGRAELVLAGVVGRTTLNASAFGAIGAAAVILWFAEAAGLAVGGLPVGGSAFLALATVSVAVVCAGVGAVASELAPSRRIALELGGAVVAVLFMLRVLADTLNGVGWLRWTTPLGWAELMQPLTGGRPLVLLLPAGATALLLFAATRLGAERDIGTGVLQARDSADPRFSMLSSPTAQALRGGAGVLAAWIVTTAVFAFILGAVSKSISPADVSKNIQNQIDKLGSGPITTPIGYMAFIFMFVILAVCVLVIAQLGAARQEEAEQRLETLLALPTGRHRWLTGRLLLATAAAAATSLTAGLLAWAGATAAGAHVSLPRLLEAGANALPAAILFLGIAALAYSVVPRASTAIGYGLVTIAFVWNLVSALLGAPKWLADITPFAHIGLVPTEAFRFVAAGVMVAIGVACALLAANLFRRRDLIVD